MQVDVSAAVGAAIAETFPAERSSDGGPSQLDFWSGPLQAALIGFRDFESLGYDDIPQIRRLTVVDAAFGPVTFVGVLVAGDIVEIAAFALDADYWDLIDSDPDD